MIRRDKPEAVVRVIPPASTARNAAHPLRPGSNAMLCTAIALVGALTFAAAMTDPPFSPDSWAYWELSKTIFSGAFYHLTTWRSFQNTIPFSAALPPLWPTVNACVAAVLSTGPITLMLCNIAVLAAFVAASAAAGRVAFGNAAVGLVAVLLSLQDRAWLDELVAGRSIPLQTVFASLLVAVLASPWPAARRFGLAGVLCGLMLANRTDAPACVAALSLLLLLTPDRRWLPVFAAAACIPVLPWVYYSLTHFGTVLATDSKPVAMSADPTAFVTDWRPSWAPSLRDAPVMWLHKIYRNAATMSGALMAQRPNAWLANLPLALGAIAALAWQARRNGADAPRLVSARASVALLAVWLALLAVVPGMLATGYFDERYLAPLSWLTRLIVLGTCCRAVTWLRPRWPVDMALLVFGVVLAMSRTVVLASLPLALTPAAAFAHPTADAAILACLTGQPPGTVMFLDDDTAAARFGALTGHRAALRPRNLPRLSREQQREFLRRYDIGAVTWSSPGGEAIARELGAERLPGCDNVARVPLAQRDASPGHASLSSLAPPE